MPSFFLTYDRHKIITREYLYMSMIRSDVFMLKVLSLFSGVGAFEMALRNIGVNVNLIGFSEVEEKAVTSYCAIHGVDNSLNLGDITKIDVDALPLDIDLLTHGSPCQDFSTAGYNRGGDENSNTRSSLMWNTVEIVSKVLPKYVIWENVKNVVSSKHIHNFNKYLKAMEDLGYVNYYKVLNSKDYGLPQNRERIFVVSIRKDLNKSFSFPPKVPLTTKVSDYLIKNPTDDLYLPPTNISTGLIEFTDDYNIIHIKQATKLGYAIMKRGGVCDLNYPSSKTRRGRVQGNGDICPTITASNQSVYYIEADNKVRKLASIELWRLMGFTDDDYYKAERATVSKTALNKQAGNSIAVPVLEGIFKNLLL